MSGVVADASPLIAFQQIGHLSLVEALFAELIMPPAVAREVAASVPRHAWVVERRLTVPLAPQVIEAALGAGESEAISLALEMQADRLIVDEKAGRHLAQALGLSVVGSLGLLLAAKRKHMIPAVRPLVQSLLETNFWISPQLVQRALAEVGEAGDR